jgi:hypothetical protein
MKRVLAKLIYLTMRLVGFKGSSASLMIAAFKKDFINRNVPFSTKLWAWKRGFMGSRVYTYGINKSNYRNHIPDFDYYKLHPINGRYSSWIDDKLTMKYILTKFNEYLPKYYFQIGDGEIIKLMDCPNDIEPDIDGVINLLKRDGNLALKLLSGSLGKGFYRLTYKNMVFYVNTNETNISELRNLIKKLKGYIVTEYIIAHKEIREIYDVTPNTLRVLMIRDKNKLPKITGGFMRFGTKSSGLLEITAAGTIFTAIDFKTGITYDPKRFINNNLENLKFHPDTNKIMEIPLPYWGVIKEKVYEISNHIPQLSYLGFDIIITDNGFKIIEINSLSALTFIEYYNPFLKNKYCKDFFTRKFKENPKNFKRVLKTLDN